jgi:hypothetical protein
METFVAFGMLILIVVAALRAIFLTPQQPRIIYIQAVPVSEPQQGQGCLGFLLTFVFVLTLIGGLVLLSNALG